MTSTKSDQEKMHIKLWWFMEMNKPVAASSHASSYHGDHGHEWLFKVLSSKHLIRNQIEKLMKSWGNLFFLILMKKAIKLQGIFPTQGSNPDLPHCRQILFASRATREPKNTGVGSLSLLQWIFLTRNQTRISCIVGRFFTSWATREASRNMSATIYKATVRDQTLC